MGLSFTRYVEENFHEQIIDAAEAAVKETNYRDIPTEVTRTAVWQIDLNKLYSFDDYAELPIIVAVTIKSSEDGSEYYNKLFMRGIISGTFSEGLCDFGIILNEILSNEPKKLKMRVFDDLLIKSQTNDLQKEINRIIAKAYPHMGYDTVPHKIDPIAIAKQYGYSVQYASLGPKDKVRGAFALSESTIDIYDAETDTYHPCRVSAKNILVNKALYGNWEIVRFTVAHELNHAVSQRFAFWFKRICDKIDSPFCCPTKIFEDYRFMDDFVDRAERQADQGASLLLMPRAAFRAKAQEILDKYGENPDPYDFSYAVKETANYFGVSVSAAKRTFNEENFEGIAGVFNYIDGGYVPPFGYKKGCLAKDETFVISAEQLRKILSENKKLAKYIAKGRLCFIENHLVINASEFIRGRAGGRKLTPYARAHIDECAIKFKLVFANQQVQYGINTRCRTSEGNILYRSPYSSMPVSVIVADQSLSIEERAARLNERNEDVTAITKQIGNDFPKSLDAVIKWTEMENKEIAEAAWMGETFKYVAPLAGTLGYSAEDTAIAVGLMANAGIKGSQAGTSLKTALANMAAPTSKQAAAMEELGISLSAANGDAYSLMDVMQQLRSAISGTNVEVTDADGNLRDYDDILADISETTDGLSKVQQIQAASTIFGKESMAGLLSIINASDEDFAKLTESIYNCNGAAQQMAQIKLDNLKGDLTLLSSAAEGAKIALGQQLAPIAREAVQSVTEIVNAFNDGGLNSALSKVSELVGQLATELQTKIPEILPGLMSSFNSILMTLFQSIGTLLPGLIETILPILILSFTDLLSQLAAYISSALPEILQSILSAFMQIGDNLKQTAPKILTAVREIFSQLVSFISSNAPEIISTGIDLMSGFLQGLLSSQPDIINGALTLIKGLVNGLIQNLPMLLNAAVSIVQALCNGLIQNLPTIIQAALNLILQLVSGLIQNLPLIVQAAVQMVTSLVQGLVQSIPMIIQAAIDFIVNFINGLITNLPLIIQAAVDLVVGLVQGLLQAIPLIVEAIPQIVGAIVDGLFSIDWLELGASILQALWDGIMSLVGGLLSSWWDIFTSLCSTVADWAVSIWNTAKEAISNFCSAVVDTNCELPGKVWNWLCDVVDKVVSWGADMVSSAIDAMTEMASVIIDTISELPGEMVDIGANIVEGIWNGISGAAGWLFDQISGFCSDIWNGVKDFFGINSPSKLFKEELGFNLVYGLAEGIDKKVNTAVKAVNTMGTDVMTAAKKSLDANWSITGFDSVPTGNTVINNYYTNDNSRIVNQTNNSPKSLSRLEVYRMTRNALNV